MPCNLPIANCSVEKISFALSGCNIGSTLTKINSELNSAAKVQNIFGNSQPLKVFCRMKEQFFFIREIFVVALACKKQSDLSCHHGMCLWTGSDLKDTTG